MLQQTKMKFTYLLIGRVQHEDSHFCKRMPNVKKQDKKKYIVLS